jgi:hypothetical protein
MFHVPINMLPKKKYLLGKKKSQTTLRAEDNYERSKVPELDGRRCLHYSAKLDSVGWSIITYVSEHVGSQQST